MIDFLKNFIINIVFVCLVIVIVEIILPQGSIKKYVNLVFGFVIIITILNPIIKFFNANKKIENIDIFQNTKTQAYIKTSVINNSEKEQNAKIIDLYKKKLIEKIKQTVESEKGVEWMSGEVLINEDAKKETFGAINKVNINLIQSSNVGNKTNINIGNINVEEIKLKKKSEYKNKTLTQNEEELVNKLKTRLVSVLGVQESDVVVTFCERNGG